MHKSNCKTLTAGLTVLVVIVFCSINNRVNQAQIADTVNTFIIAIEANDIEKLKGISAGGFRYALDYLQVDEEQKILIRIIDYTVERIERTGKNTCKIRVGMLAEVTEFGHYAGQIYTQYDLGMIESEGEMRIFHYHLSEIERSD